MQSRVATPTVIRSSTFTGVTNINVKQEGGSPLSVPGIDHTHKSVDSLRTPQAMFPSTKTFCFYADEQDAKGVTKSLGPTNGVALMIRWSLPE